MSSSSNLTPARLMAVALLAVALPISSAQAEAEVETDTQKAVYLIGVDFAQKLQALYLTDDEIEVVVRAIRDQHAGNAIPLDPQTYAPKLRTLQEQRSQQALAIEKPKGEEYLAKQRKEAGAKETDSGLIFTSVEPGSGASPEVDSKVKVHYTGTLRDGQVFDSSVARGVPAEFVVGKVIQCWNEALPMMKTGGKARLVCPADIAYGDGGVPGAIPPGAVLTFEVELISVE